MNFGNAFERELGKNTGKWVSNAIFGDGHATPIRRVQSNRQELLHEQKMAHIAIENKRIEKERIFAIDDAVLMNVDIIAAIKIPQDKFELIDLLSELATQIKANRWHTYTEEGRVRNKFCEALLEKYSQTVQRLKNIDANDFHIEHYEKIGKDFKKKRFLKKNLPYLILGAIFLVVFFVYFIVYLDQKGLLGIVFGSIVFLTASITGYKYYIRKKEGNNPLNSENKKSEQTVEQTKITNNTVYIDLNENNRIEKKLSEIWNKYKVKIDTKIINRKPIFSADGVEGSILFVGINPSYNSSDDNILINSLDNNSLMYGSLYQLADAPEYFKKLEVFASKINKSYTHINLLYARENERDVLLGCNHNFIREQLELTYETILKLKPVAIIFFNDYTKDLIFGEDRWVSPNSGFSGCYLLNKINIPVFFTDDVTSLSEENQLELIKKMRKILNN